MEWAIFGAAWVFAIIGLSILGDNARQKRKLATQELFQKERLAAMEQGLPIPEWNASLLDENPSATASPEAQANRMQWFRFVSLWAGVVLAFGGVGMGFAFGMSGDLEFRKMASLGILPMVMGVGLLLFAFMTRNLNKP